MRDEGASQELDDLIHDLKLLREKGLQEVDDLDLSALSAASKVVIRPEPPDNGAAVEILVRRAVARLSGGNYGDALQALLGLTPDTRVLTAGVRRSMAAAALGCGLSTFLRKHEEPMLRQVARQIVVLSTEQQMRDGREQLVARHPVESKIALHWIEMFQAYYRLWSPIYALGADLTAARATLLEKPRPYDRLYGTHGPDDPGYSQEEQAEGYARFALYWYSIFEWELRRFRALYGGLWMLSSTEIETEVRDAVYRIYWNVQPLNERDVSALRTLIDDTPNQELHPFLERLAADEAGVVVHERWQEWTATCSCAWAPESTPDDDYFPTAKNQPGISVDCAVHQVVDACGVYCELIDCDWAKIADWYQLDEELRKGIAAEKLYTDWRSTAGLAEGSS